MRLAIVQPCIGRIPGRNYLRSWQMEPLQPAYLAGLCSPDIQVAFHDDRMETIPYDESADLVAISVETYTAKRAYQIATEYRRRGVPVVMGGFHATLVPEEVLEYAEAVVVGEAEQAFPQLLQDFRNGSMKRLYRQPVRSDISNVMPDRSIFQGRRYLKLGLIEASRGCPFKCDFCSVTSYFKATQTRRPMAIVVDEVRRMKDEKKLFFFVDDNIAARPDVAKELYSALIPLKIRWISQASITVTYDDEMLAIMKRSGCQGVLIGFESLNSSNLESMNKSFNDSHGGFEPALKKLKRFGMRLYATFVFGYEHDTLQGFSRTVKFCIDNKIFMVSFNHITPFPGTPLYKRLQTEGRLLYDKWWLDDGYRYGQVPFQTALPPDRIKDECDRSRKEFYSISSTFKRMFDRTNAGSLLMLHSYWFINLLLRKEASQRESYPLGDESFTGRLLKTR